MLLRLFSMAATLLVGFDTCKAQNITLSPGSAVRYTFNVDPTAWGSSTPSVVRLGVFAPAVLSSTPAKLTAGLYNGTTLLGVASTDPLTSADTPAIVPLYWKSPTSLWPDPPSKVPVVDFTSILNGSLQGRIDLSVTGGSVSLPPPIFDPPSGFNCCISLMYQTPDGVWAFLAGTTNVAQTFVASAQPPPATIQEIAQIADGAGWKTSFAFVNLDSAPVSFTMQFWGQNGESLPIPFAASSSGSIAGAIAPGESWFMQTAGTSPSVLQGWAEVSSTGRLGVTAIFTQSIPGKQDSEGTVSATVRSSGIVLPYDNTQGFVTGLAVANTNPDLAVTVSVVLRPEGATAVQGSLTIPKHGQLAFMLPNMFPTVSNTRGAIELTGSTADLAAIGLRSDPNGSFTSLPSFQR